MFNSFTEDARKILIGAKEEIIKLRHPYVGIEHLLLSILKDNNDISVRLKDYNLDYDRFKKEIINLVGEGSKKSDCFLYTPLLKRVMENAIYDSRENNNGNVTINHLFSSLLEEGEGIAIRIMLGLNIDLDKLTDEFMYRPIKKDSLLNELGIDLTKKDLDIVIGREKEIERLLEILSRRCKNNPILVGEAGVGKTAIVEHLAYLIKNNKVPLNLRNKRIISLDMASLVAGTKYRGEFEEKLKKIIKEIENDKDITLFIDEIHTLVGAGGAEGAIDASNILKPALARGKIRCIGATTTLEYKKYIEKDKALDRRFQKIIVDIPNKEETKQILLKTKKVYEKYHKVSIDDELVKLIVDLSEKYIVDRNEPDRSLDILDEVCASVSIKKDDNLKKYDKLKAKYKNIVKIKKQAIKNNNFNKASKYKEKENEIQSKINDIEINLYHKKIKQVKKEDIYKVLENKIPNYNYELDKVIGQKEAIEEIKKSINKCHSYLFIGPIGVGKTMTAKLLGKNPIKLDMNEFTESHSISKIVGSPPGYVGYDCYNNILEDIRTNPVSTIILDNIDKAHPNILNLFLNALEEGYIKDSKGNKVNFNNVLVIMTSSLEYNNVGFIKNNKEQFDFINKIDKVIKFNSLKEEDMIELIKTKIDSNDNNLVREILNQTQYKKYGARKLDKIIKDYKVIS